MDDLVEIIDTALRRRGWSAQHASMTAAGSPDCIRDVRRGRLRHVEEFRRLCEALDPEFYVGPRREYPSIDENRPGVALKTTMRAVKDAHVELEPAQWAQAIAALDKLVGCGEGTSANAEHLQRLVRTMTRKREGIALPVGYRGARVTVPPPRNGLRPRRECARCHEQRPPPKEARIRRVRTCGHPRHLGTLEGDVRILQQ